MNGKTFIRRLRLENFLSYGSEGEEIELRPLNILIGSNASGKSNLIEAIALLKATPTDLPAFIRQAGGISEFLWKGQHSNTVAEIQAIVDYPRIQTLSYQISLSMAGQKLELIDEFVENEQPFPGEDDVYFYYRYQRGRPVLNVKLDGVVKQRELRREDMIPDQSVLSQRKDPDLYPELSYLATQFSNISLYRIWNIGRDSEPRNPQKTDLPEHPLLENGSNLGLFLNNLQYQLGNRQIIEKLKKFYDAAEELSIKIYGGTVQIFIREENLAQPIPATRLSDGTLRYLFLMALLLDPTPPPLICIEEPEIGLHPDILPTIAEMLIEASQRTQLIVTTHSDALVSSLPPEAVLVFERDEQGSHLRRLDPEKLKDWLENYTLGDLWRMGEIGGTRW
ncbi:AAA family ATPase [Aetokthonos hydrillicola Thurmond2011]|uniref:AAA family ATPase n=1 Tax=Aetokthonos hydrillicola Thurmond2011 TaxID=2712845 RepID=A0AAP5I275_9CYAN|nr:AAA family ATPase [Aetokthonos hydrillicola]MBO3457475.1 AAA family ATPase [Aetokthonos hydrillicola CCALA 1050]MBW4586003.1 AAA family ATPase [Aetokthonos hydrillicola CCALA 1050]MDR9893768.1 AAA family ATPase [Aetokthonos hydrillicola Thurmond2011]